MAGKLDERHSTAAEEDPRASVPTHGGSTAGEGRKVQVCLKLPGGERLQAEFDTSQRITDLVSYAQQFCGEDLSECEVATNEVPRQVVTDWQVTLEQAGITVRTLLYLSMH